ncbi:hypothetical protein [Deinococcus ruber]|uniref:Uncharacterized protein n=1 Tax=Deinococcus ruber TaxID=1848197 RepID=A0A918KX59_9DEIO|nr:hypothetical protein [Deinococcus ruber]GGR38942.1 hypothetical protein GCM10008957_54880 [Deinococcus ruber]
MSEKQERLLSVAVEAAYVGMTGQAEQITDLWLWAIKAAPSQGFGGFGLSDLAARTKRLYAGRGAATNKIKRCNGRSKNTPLPNCDQRLTNLFAPPALWVGGWGVGNKAASERPPNLNSPRTPNRQPQSNLQTPNKQQTTH